MKAFIVDRYGSAYNVRFGETAQREPPGRQDQERGVQAHRALPAVAGVVVRVGSRVRKFKPGDEVHARPDQNRIGTFAEFVSVKEHDLAPKPEKLTMDEAAAVPLAALTAWQALIERTNLKSG